MAPTVIPQLVANNGTAVLRAAIADPDRYACEPKVDGVRGLTMYGPDGLLETRNRSGIRRDWLRGDAFEGGLRRLGNRLPILWNGTVLDGELTTGRFQTTMAALFGSKRHCPDLRLVVFDVPVLAGVDLRPLPWQERRARLELLAQAFDIPLELSPVIAPTAKSVVEDGTMKSNTTIVALTGHEKPRQALLDRAALLGRETGATVILFDRDADMGPLMSPLPTDWSADGEEEQFPNRLTPKDLDAAGQAGLAEQVERIRAVGVRAFGWLPPKADAKALAEYASQQGAENILVSAEDDDFIDGLRSLSEPPNQVEVVPPG